MPIVTSLDRVTRWVDENICKQVQLKLPAQSTDEPEGAGYSYTLVTPAAFTLFIPTKDRLPPKILAPIPSVCVRLIEGNDSPRDSDRSMLLQLCFSTWDTGVHGPDIIKPDDQNPGKFIRSIGENARKFYERNGDGWRDAWNLVDVALREIENTEYIAGLRLEKEEPIKFGPLAEQDAIPDYYPYWYAWIEFRLSEKIVRKKAQYQNLL